MTRLEQLTDADYVELMEQAFSAVEEVCSQISGADWERPTDCPGWSVKDNLAHLAHFEAVSVGRPDDTDVDVAHCTHAASDFQKLNERGVEARRKGSSARVLEEFRDVTAARMKQLASLDETGWQSNVTLPVGERPQRTALPMRILDVFYHEQDIRRALARPGHLDGAVSGFVLEWMVTQALPRVVGKNTPEGTLVAFELPGRTVRVATSDGKGAIVEEGSPAVTLRTDVETLLCLLGGRWRVERARADGRLTIEGDEAIARAVLDNIVVVP